MGVLRTTPRNFGQALSESVNLYLHLLPSFLLLLRFFIPTLAQCHGGTKVIVGAGGERRSDLSYTCPSERMLCMRPLPPPSAVAEPPLLKMQLMVTHIP
uniref:Uncharacterized protein n=1 Tax=Knipowitschia caucasica TaxID=637954 RepID=A0AAV2M853_KNICA